MPNWRKVREDGRELTGLLNLSPTDKWEIEEGRLSTDWLNKSPKERWVRDCGRELIEWRKCLPKERWVILDGKELIDWSKWQYSLNLRWMSEEGRQSSGWLNLPPIER